MPGRYDLDIAQGATFRRVFTWKIDAALVDLTGYTARAQLRRSVDDAAPALSLTAGSGLTLGGAAGTITLVITDTQTTTLAFETGVWDLELVSPGGEVTRLLEGRVSVGREVTR